MLNKFRELTKSFGNQVESERTEQLKRTKAEFEKNVTRHLELIKNENRQVKGKRNAPKTEQIELVENLCKEFESLYNLCEHLIQESNKPEVSKPEGDTSSESEYYSSEELDTNHSKLESEISELRRKFGAMIEENKALGSKVQEVENINKGLRNEVDKKGREISGLAKVNEANGKKSTARIKELESRLTGFKIEKEKRKGLLNRVLELESVLKAKEDENSALLKKLEENEKSFALKNEELSAQKSVMQGEIDSLCSKKGELEEELASERENRLVHVKELVDQKSGLEVELERKSSEIFDHRIKIESLSEELAKTIVEKSKVLEEEMQMQKDDTASSQDFNTQIDDREDNSESDSSERKSEESAKIAIMTKLRVKDVERKMEDIAEKFRVGFEDNIRLLYQRILVTEQLHSEIKESHKTVKNENMELKEKIENYENDLENTKSAFEASQHAMTVLASLVGKFEEQNGHFSNRIFIASNELKIAKRWVKGTTGEIKRLKHNVDCLVAFLDHKEEEEFMLRDKVWKLEAKMSKESGEKLNLIQEVSQLEKKIGKYERLVKEKDERIVSLGEEKKEVIRQLCISVDYHRSRVDQLKHVVLNLRRGW